MLISDEYGPAVYQFDRMTGKHIKSFASPANLAITHLSPQKAMEKDNSLNPVGRVTNKGMEGLAITPDGKMLMGIMQANLELDKKKSLRIATIADPLKLPGDPTRGSIANPNQFYVFAFGASDLPGFQPQQIRTTHN